MSCSAASTQAGDQDRDRPLLQNLALPRRASIFAPVTAASSRSGRPTCEDGAISTTILICCWRRGADRLTARRELARPRLRTAARRAGRAGARRTLRAGARRVRVGRLAISSWSLCGWGGGMPRPLAFADLRQNATPLVIRPKGVLLRNLSALALARPRMRSPTSLKIRFLTASFQLI